MTTSDPRHPPARAARLCDALRDPGSDPAPAVDALRTLGPAAVPALVDLLDERGAGYAFAVRLLAEQDTPEARAALRGVLHDRAARDCDRFEAAAALDERGDPEGFAALRRLSETGSLRAAAWFLVHDRFEDRDLALGPWLDDDELRPLVVEDLVARGHEPGGSLDDPGQRARFREGWRSGVRDGGGA